MSTSPTTYDAIVVGARAAGASTAMLLARAGRRVLLLDQAHPGTDTLSTHALMRGGVLQLSRWGLLDDVVAAGTPPIRRTTFRYHDGDVTIPIKATSGVDALYAPRRTVLDPLLGAAATAAGVEARYGVMVTGVRRDRTGRVTGVDFLDKRRFPGSAEATIVIGADGRRSTIARLVDARFLRRATNGSAFVYGYWTGLDADGYEWAYRGGVSAGFIPTNDGATCVFAGSTPDAVGRGGRPVLEEIAGRASPAMAARLAAAGAPRVVRTFRGQPGHLRQAFGPGWALVGDASAWKDPVSAHGLTEAFRDAELLARAVVAAADRSAEADVFGAYQHDRDRLTTPLLLAADEIAAGRWSATRIVELLAALNTAMADEVAAITSWGDPPRRDVAPAA
jgi:2-polyprenyl-6-methoxyphenol hydroxylase-like FAD-dependent oxidoreductase